MNAFADTSSPTKPAWHDSFVAMMPSIYDRLRFAFGGFSPESREEAIQESLALALAAYVRLFELGKAEIAYAAPLAMYAARQYRAGRRVGSRMNRNDLLSERAQRHHGIVVERLVRRDQSGAWKERLVEDKTSTPAETAIARIDFADWLSRLCRRDRGLATTLATGETGRNTAKLYGITAGRVTQLRSKLRRNWERFQGEVTDEAGELAMAGC